MIHDIMVRASFPQEATDALDEAYRRLISDPETDSLLTLAEEEMYLLEDESYLKRLDRITELSGVHEYTVHLVFWLICTGSLRYIYSSHGISEDMWVNVCVDLRCKLMECRNVYGIWGVFTDWFRSFYLLRRYAFERLEFDVIRWEDGDYRGLVSDGDLAFNCHIPSSGPLLPELVTKSLKQLYDFSKDRLKNGVLPIKCSSWLIYPPIVDICPEGSNMRSFAGFFDIVGKREYGDPYHNFWRVYNMDYTGPESLEKAPEDTGLRRRLKKYLKDGGVIGYGIGYIMFDGEKIINGD